MSKRVRRIDLCALNERWTVALNLRDPLDQYRELDVVRHDLQTALNQVNRQRGQAIEAAFTKARYTGTQIRDLTGLAWSSLTQLRRVGRGEPRLPGRELPKTG